MNTQHYSIKERLLSVFASLLFTLPTAFLIWFGFIKEMSLSCSDCVSGPGYPLFFGLIGGFSLLAFFAPTVFPSILSAVWRGMVRLANGWI